MLFLPSYNLRGEMYPTLTQGWTLIYEMFFYLCLAVASRVCFRGRTLIVAAGFGLLVLARPFVDPANEFSYCYTDPILLEFVLGCVAAELYLEGSLRFAKTACIAMILGGSALLLAGSLLDGSALSRAVYWGGPSFVILIGVIGAEAHFDFSKWRVLGAIGDSSYSLYLSHSLVLSAMGVFYGAPLFRLAGGAPFALVVMAVCCVVGWRVYVGLERPITRRLGRSVKASAVRSDGPSRQAGSL